MLLLAKTGCVYYIQANISQFLNLDSGTLFRNKRFALNEMFQRNASKFAIFYVVYENHVVLFVFHFVQFYIFTYDEKNYTGFLIHKI